MKSILIICADTISERIAGTGIRSLALARYLGKQHHVDLLVSNDDPPTLEGINFIHPDRIKAHYDIVISQSPAEKLFIANGRYRRSLTRAAKYFDLYCPSIFEDLEKHKRKSKKYIRSRFLLDIARINLMLEIGDHFICGNERQRDLYLELARQLGKKIDIDVIPFGISETQPTHDKKVLKGIVPGINETDKVILWWGGVWEWYNPELLIGAMSIVKNLDPSIKLFFASNDPPVKNANSFKNKLKSTIDLSKELGLYSKNVFFADKWIDYKERENYLSEVDAGAVMQPYTLETFFSCRARIFEYLWAGLPVILNEGDTFAELVASNKLGMVHSGDNPERLASEIVRFFNDKVGYEACKKNINEMRGSMYWGKVLEPLLAHIDRTSERKELSFRQAFRVYLKIFRYFAQLAGFYIGNFNATRR